MKKIVKSFILVAVAAMGFTACQKEIQEEVPVNEGTVQVTFVSGSPETKTSVDTSGEVPVFAWDENETFAVLEQTDALAEATSVTYAKVDGKANITATFTANPGKGSYNYVTVYPANGYKSGDIVEVDGDKHVSATLSLPVVQTMAEGSYDPNADLMVSEVVSANAQPTEAQMVSFTRMAAVVKMTLKNFDLESGDEVEQVIFTAEGKKLAGTVTADLADDPHKFTVAEGVDNVTVNTTSSSDVYFTVLPTTLEAGDAYTVTVITNKKLYIKKGAIPEDKALEFKKGMVTRLGVDMKDVAPIDKWVLVKDASTLKQGDVVAIAAKDYDKALSTQLSGTETSTTVKRNPTDISRFLSYMIAGTDVQRLILVTGEVEGTFSFYDEARQKFLVSTTKNSTYLINQEYCNENTSFAITTDADAAATITNTTGTYAGNLLRYNSNGYFVSNQNTSTVYKAVCIYRLDGAVGEIPVVDAVLTVPDSDEFVVIAEEGAAVATDISTEQVTFNYVGPWTISAEAAAEWLNVAYDATKNCLTYTAEANTGAKRETTVTITATLDGQDDLSWSFKVIQKGVPQDISIADFVKLSKDENSTYRITGRITEMTTSNSGTFKLTDGNDNVATVMYLYTDGGVKVSGNNEIGVAVGDVMTVTTVPVGSGKGGNSSHESIYKGHYGLSTIKGLAADYRGGTVEIDVTTYSNGTITLPDAVEASITDNDYAELTYSDGKAVVTFATENETSDAREAVVTFTYGLIKVEVVAEQGVNPANRVGWNLVTNASTLAIGNEVVIVAMNSDKVLGAQPNTVSASGITSTSNFPAVEVDRSGNIVYDVDKAGALVFTLAAGKDEGTFALQFTHKDADYYLNAPSTGLKGRAVSSGVNAATSYTITIDSETGKATIQSGQPKLVMFNGATGTAFLSVSPGTANATKAEYAVSIYRK